MIERPRSGRRASPRIGVVGAGQLARMLHEAASPLAIDLVLLAERRDDCAALASPNVIVGSPTSPSDLAALAAETDVLTFDHELVDATVLAELAAAGHAVHPSADVVRVVQNKLAQRTLLASRALPCPAFAAIGSADDVFSFGREHGWPVVVKALRGGYDGRGVWILADETEAARFVADNDVAVKQMLVEEHVPIERELAVLVARRPSGECAVYPVVETVQIGGICREIVAQATVSRALAESASEIGVAIANALEVVGILAVELFEAGGALTVNELAARPHNSGHYSIEGCVTSQFEQHLRAILDWPLGPTDLVAPAVATVNVLGGADGTDPAERLPAALTVPGAHVHLYGKSARPGRKLGHVTVLADDAPTARSHAQLAARLLVEDDDRGEAR